MQATVISAPILDLNPVTGLLFEWRPAPEDPERDRWGVINVMAPGFGNLPLHHHKEADETFTVESGVLEVWHAGRWNRVGPGESYTVPAGGNHTLRNRGEVPVRLLDEHEPALEFPRYILQLHALVAMGKVKNMRRPSLTDLIYVGMLQQRYKREITSVFPPEWATRALAALGRRRGMRLPIPTPPELY
jgi:mannose-6-phosphate isomerase-like protein (cupin superfamily)